MKVQMRLMLVAAASTLVVACGGQNADDAEPTGAEVESAAQPPEGGAMAGMANDPSNPFGQAEMRMNERMMAAVGTNAGDSWTRKMIEHHRGAVDMSNVVLGQSPTPEVAEMARMTIDKQQKEISDLERMIQQGAPAPQSAELYRPAMMQMHERMMAATGANPSETWMRKMTEHHKGAIDMSNVVLAQQPGAQVREKAQKTRTDQQKESEKLERMMRGEPAEPKQAAATKAAPKEKSATAPKAAQPRAAEKSAAAPKAAPKAQLKASPVDPHAGMDMNNM